MSVQAISDCVCTVILDKWLIVIILTF
jgi:hypothetical protein